MYVGEYFNVWLVYGELSAFRLCELSSSWVTHNSLNCRVLALSEPVRYPILWDKDIGIRTLSEIIGHISRDICPAIKRGWGIAGTWRTIVLAVDFLAATTVRCQISN